MTTQTVTIELHGITAGDYLAWVRDPDPAPAAGLESLELRAEPFGDTVTIVLRWEHGAPTANDAVAAAGLELNAHVADVRSRAIANGRAPRRRGPARRKLATRPTIATA